jgi:3-hydroxyisobutyrate dehydrogenase-like beta-hydroxyacid dehydrogenase
MVQPDARSGQTIGFIGIGAMGFPMATCLANSGRRVVTYDIAPSLAARQRSDFAWANSPGDVAAQASTVLLSLPHVEASEDVINELGSSPTICNLVIDTCTQDPAQAQVFADRLRATDIGYCDAPVFGTPRDAAAATLTVAYSCPEELCESVEAVLRAFTRRQIHVGQVGTASLFKVVQNSLGLVQLVAIAEAFAVVELAGADPTKFYDVVKGSGGMADSPFFAKVGRDFADKQHRFGALLRVAMKDIELGRVVADRAGAEANLTTAAAALFERAERLGMGDADLASIGQALGGAVNA